MRDVQFTARAQAPSTSRQLQASSAPNQATTQPFPASPQRTTAKTASPQGYEQAINIQDADKWPIASLLVRHFPGKIKQTKDYS